MFSRVHKLAAAFRVPSGEISPTSPTIAYLVSGSPTSSALTDTMKLSTLATQQDLKKMSPARLHCIKGSDAVSRLPSNGGVSPYRPYPLGQAISV